MFTHIVADAKKIANQARNLTKNKEAHRWIVQLSRPLADVIDLINENVAAIHKKSQFLENCVLKEKIEENLFVPKICLQLNELKQPITVCTSAQCCEFYSENNKKQHYYKQKCHDPCSLTNIPGDIIGSPELMYCAAMNAHYYCKKCSCHFSKHMHVLYLTRKTEQQIRDIELEGNYNEKRQVFLERLHENATEYQAEGEFIVKIMAKFSHFLKQHGYSSDNDAYEKYLLYLIGREVKYGPDSDLDLIKHYKSMLKDYREEKINLDKFLSSNNDDKCAVSSEEIFTSVEKLFQLKHTGQQLKDLHEVQLKCTNMNEKDRVGGSSSGRNSKKATL
ncbi:uncharacterized protein [Onthophagus taurus]|uniref:uncharacterized protein n=1 Tax=Onthophagus taurus TaxID=166361 RepID=UPI000C20D75F|nr:uncharacterized protein LOC111429214 [Onthophagus taurus]